MFTHKFIIGCRSFLLASLLVLTAGASAQLQTEQARQLIGQTGYLSFKERTYVHTDKDFYLAGEMVWFKVYVLQEGANTPVNYSKVAYVEILDRAQKPVAQAKIVLTDKGGDGVFYLPLNLQSDAYTIRAYTSWMQNFSPANFFHKSISIVNTIKPTGLAAQGGTDKITVDFFPEGGDLVHGIESKIAFRVAGANNKGIEVNGIVTTTEKDTVLQFASEKFGIGQFSFKPVAGKRYIATIKLPGGQSVVRALPEMKAQGFVMNVVDNKDGKLAVRVSARRSSSGSDDIYLAVHSRQMIRVAEQARVKDNEAFIFYIDKNKLAEGVNYFTLFNDAKQPVAERLFFKKPSAAVLSASITTDKLNYGSREKMTMSFKVNGARDSIADAANCSVSIFYQDSISNNEANGIRNYMWLTADMNGDVESPDFYFSADPSATAYADNLMLVHGWRRFKTTDPNYYSSKRDSLFTPEYKGHLIAARVVDTWTGRPAPEVVCALTVSSNPHGTYIAQTDSNGVVKFDVKNYYGPGDIVIKAGLSSPANAYKVQVINPFSDSSSFTFLPAALFLDKKEEADILTRSIAMQAQNVYNQNAINKFIAPEFSDTLHFFGKPEFSYLLDDYKRFATMEEVLREYVTSINVSIRDGKPAMSIYDEKYQRFYSENLLVLMDGVPMTDYNKLFAYDPLKVRKIDIVPRRYILGPANFNGVVSFETYQGKFDAFEMDPGAVAVDYEGLQLKREFFSPVYANGDKGNNRIPDYRTTLKWLPNVLIGKDKTIPVESYTSDIKGDFIIVLEGITAGGVPIRTSSQFSVK